MSKGLEVANELKEARNNLYNGVSFFNGGNVGNALLGKYIAESNQQLTAAINNLAMATRDLANRPIIIKIDGEANTPKKSAKRRK